jgi:hypothetical protein
MIDTLKLARRLEAAQLPKEQAEALAEGLNESLKESYVSREFLRAEVARLTTELSWRIVFIVVAVVGLFNSALFWALSNLVHSIRT